MKVFMTAILGVHDRIFISPIEAEISWEGKVRCSRLSDSTLFGPENWVLIAATDKAEIRGINSGHQTPFTSSRPPQRPWIYMSETEPQFPCVFTVMCYNILCDKYATRQMYGYCPNWALDWSYRKKHILQEILHYKADIISLQEVETEQFYKYFLPELKNEGYDGIFSPKSRAKTMSESERKHVDGCAIFYKNDKFTLVREHLMEFNQLAMANAEGSDEMLNRVMTKDNIGLAALLQTKSAAYSTGTNASQMNQVILVCTAHIHWDPEFSDVKLIQTMMLMHEMKTLVDDILQKSNVPIPQKGDPNVIPLLLCGDFNSLPDSGVIEYLSNGRVSSSHCDFKEFVYKDCLSKLGKSEQTNEFTHPFQISRAYNNDIMPFTNYSYDFKGVIDYVFYSKLHMSVLGVLGPIDSNWLEENRIHGCPHPHVPSDHFPIVVELQLHHTLPIQLSPPNGLILHRLKVIANRRVLQFTCENEVQLQNFWILTDSRASLHHLSNWTSIEDQTSLDILNVLG
ncbi:CCR4-NOT transcription complex subunit 6-like [Trichonephila clavipes]|nr:CCR4-NOT transcription complex subunit 6-like [Trichonephila clavipes]